MSRQHLVRACIHLRRSREEEAERDVPLETYLFVVRLWREESDQIEGPGVWRGSLKQPATGQQIYFRSLTELVDALSLRSGFPSSDC